MYIKEQNFLVLGLSKSGYAVAKYILENGGKCYLFEELSSPKIDKAIKQQQLENTLSNIETSTTSIVSSLDSLNSTMPNVDSSLNQTREMMCNLNAITCGIRKTLAKNFGLMRLFFGKVAK